MKCPEVLVPLGWSLKEIANASNLPPFGELQLEFANAISRELISPVHARAYPELAALGFWLRASNLKKILQNQVLDLKESIFMPRGLAFHIAPSNVDTIFVYSMLISLICGNRNIVRISSRISSQTEVLLKIFQLLLQDERWNKIAQRIAIIRYGHDHEITTNLSMMCDVRVVWGGDQTINVIRKAPLPPNATELAFASKFSICLLDANAVLNCNVVELGELAKCFYNDSYWFGQMACSSPRLILWRGDKAAISRAQKLFWAALQSQIDIFKPQLETADFMNKEVSADALAVFANIKIISEDNRLTRIWLDEAAIYSDEHCGSGLFHEASILSLHDMLPLLNRKVQTLSYYGVTRDEILKFVQSSIPLGIDRFVEVGKALNFGTIWDGNDLFRSFLREVAY